MSIDPHTIFLREYESCHVGIQWSASTRTITARQVAAISAYQDQTGTELFTIGHRRITATNWVGTFGLGDKAIEVIPKIDPPPGQSAGNSARENLLAMIAAAGYVPLVPADIARLTADGKPLLAAFLDLYVDHLAREWRRGPLRRYVTCTENRPYLKGKLLVAEQQRANAFQQQRFFTAADEFIEDCEASRLLKAALHACQRQQLSAQVTRKANGLLPDFETVEFVAEDRERVVVDRQSKRFEPLINLAKVILRHCSPSPSSAGLAVYALMFDMNNVFERFIAKEMAVALAGQPVSVQAQIRGKSLLHQDGRGRFQLRPDVGVFQGKKVVCLVDTKWKRLDMDKPYANVTQADMYQMYAYGKEFGAPRTVLLYPRGPGLSEVVASYSHHPAQSGADCIQQIVVATIDVSTPLASIEGRRALYRDLGKVVELND